MGRGVSSGGGQSSLGYLFGGGEAPKPVATSPQAVSAEVESAAPPKQLSPPANVTKQIPAGIHSTSTNNYLRADGPNTGNFLTERPSTKVHSAPGGGSSLGYLFGGADARVWRNDREATNLGKRYSPNPCLDDRVLVGNLDVDAAKARFLRVILDHLYVDPFYGAARGFLVTAICLPRKSVPYGLISCIIGMFILFFISYIDSIRSFEDLVAGWPSNLVQPNFGVMIEGGRIRLNGWQQAAVAVGSAFGALLDPRRADLIAALGETTGKPAFERVLERMKRTPEGRAVLLERPRVLSSKVGHAWDLPENTFGGADARFMGSRNFSPDDRPPIHFMDTEELAYVAMRAREVHDFWHTLFNLPSNLIGESALKVIEFEQMYLPMCMLSAVGGSARFNEKQRALFFKHYFPWAVKAGISCTNLMCIYYERHFDKDLEDVRRRWGIVPAPNLYRPTYSPMRLLV